MAESQLTEKKSLELIEEMINTARQEQGSAAFYFVMWGIITLIYCGCMWAAINYKIEWLGMAWIVFPVGGLLSFLRGRRDERVEKAKSVADRLYGYVWGGAAFYMCVVVFFGAKLGEQNIIPLIILIYALCSFTTGGATRYYPSVYGAVLCGVCSIFAFNVGVMYQFPICALAITCTHIVPGLMMKNYYKQRLNA